MASISNQAQVSFSYAGGNTQTNNSNIVTSTMLDEYGISVEKTASKDCYRPGDTITFFIQVRNTGCGCLKNFQISDTLGGENYLNYVNGSARLIVNGILTEVFPTSITETLDFTISDRIERDGGFVLLYNVTIPTDIPETVNELTNTVNVTGVPCGCGEEPVTTVSGSDSITIAKCEFAEVLITKQASRDTYCCDDQIDYFITLTNTGTVDATDVVVTDVLPTGFVTTSIFMENNNETYYFSPSEYTIDDANLLTLPNATGRAILVPSIAPGIDNTTRIVIHGHM